MILPIQSRPLYSAVLIAVAGAAVSTPGAAAALIEERGLSAYVQGRHAASAGDMDRAATLFEQALGVSPGDVHLLESTFETAMIAGDRDLATGAARQLARLGKYDSAVGTVLFVDALTKRRYEDALAEVQRLEESGFGSFMAPILRAWTLEADGETSKAFAALNEGGSSGLPDSYADEHRGHLALQNGDRMAAVDHYLALLGADTDGRNWRSRILLAEAYQRLRQNDFALQTLEPAPGAPDVLRARERIERGKRIDEVPGSPRAAVSQLLMRLAADLSSNRRVPLAMVFARAATWADGDNARAWLLSSQLLAQADQYEEALVAAQAIADDDMYDSISRAQTAAILEELERRDEALTMLEAAAQSADADARTLVLLGEGYQRAERFEAAAGAFEAALSRDISDEQLRWQTLFLLGAAQEQMGDFAASEVSLRAALAIEPDQPTVLNYLGYMLLDRNEKVPEAIDLIERAHAAEPQNGHITDSLGWAQYKQGDYETAVETLEEAVASVPGDPTINDHLGDAYWQVGRRLEARFRWRAALDAEPDAALREQIETKLSYGLDTALAMMADDERGARQ
ncbi:MAG: tetratricopeptide repeat protein [Pacificimonas sp.]|jgi:tetratricopeptide (TPR) repeat protein|nr:tetratricopeptide repeat protein [Pacificimonas sp.]